MEEDKTDGPWIDQIVERVEFASEIENLDERKRELENVLGLISHLVAEHHTASSFYLLGYALYCHPDRLTSVDIQKQVECAMNSALKLEPGNAYALMYLGYNAFDVERYEEAYQVFERVDISQLGEYSRMKILEMRLCCSIALKGLTQALPMMEAFVQHAEQLPPQDIWPTVLAKQMQIGASAINDRNTKMQFARLAERLDRAGHFQNWFKLLI